MEYDFHTIIVGAGFSGLGQAIAMKKEGLHDFLVLEAASDLGGTWRDNHYPGIACDIPSATYQFSFELNPAWSRLFAPGREILQYAHHCADKYGVRSHIRFSTKVVEAVFLEERAAWAVTTSNEQTLHCRFLVNATGILTQPREPRIPGLELFAGHKMHTARWDESISLEGKRVAMIGTGASSVQILPQISKTVGSVDVYQRTPIWLVPKVNPVLPKFVRTFLAWVPLLYWMVRMVTSVISEILFVSAIIYHSTLPLLVKMCEWASRAHLYWSVRDPDTRKRLQPQYGFGCKRPSMSTSFLTAFNRPNVSLVSTPIKEITAEGIRTEDGELRRYDVLILATGFKVLEADNLPTYPIHGLHRLDLGNYWDQERYQCYEGVSVKGFPNMWLLAGPWSVTGASWFSVIEAGTAHVVRCMKEAEKRGVRRVEIKEEAHNAWYKDALHRSKRSVFWGSTCGKANSYYFDRHGDAPFVRPCSGLEQWWRSTHFPLDDYRYL